MLDKSQVQAVLFDLDGTLMDTDDQAVEALARRLRRLHWPHAEQAARRFVMAVESPAAVAVTLVDLLGLDVRLAALAQRLRCSPTQEVEFRIMDGIEAMLAELNGRYRLGVVTTRPGCDAERFLAQHGLGSLLSTVVSGESTRRLKPNPEPVRFAAQALGVPAERCIMVGDTPVDMRAARRAGAWAVGVLCGFGGRRELQRAGAHVILERTAEVAALLR